MKLLLKIYKNSLSPILHYLFPGTGCKFVPKEPSCSEYLVLMTEKHGLIRGGLMGIKRVLQCISL